MNPKHETIPTVTIKELSEEIIQGNKNLNNKKFNGNAIIITKNPIKSLSIFFIGLSYI